MKARRTPVLVTVTLLLAAGGFADRSTRPSRPVSVATAGRALMPSAAPAGALSTTWYCVGAGAGAAAGADGSVEMANPTDHPASGTVTVVPVGGAAASAKVTVAPWSVTSLNLVDVAPAPWASALVELDSGQVTAELVARASSESDAVPCSSRASDHWYFADGVTAKDASLALSLFNPFPEDAIVDLSFSTDQGRASPAAFRPIVVPGHTLVVRDIGEHVRRRNAIATEVAVRTGRVIAAQTQTRTATGKAGLSVSLGSPSLGTAWYFPAGSVTDGVDEHFAVSNPGSREATVVFQTILDHGVAEDFERAVPAHGRLDVVLNEEVGVPRGVPHSATVLSLDGVPVVVSRTLEFAGAAGPVGRADTLGARRAATRWLFAAGGPGESADEWLAVMNPGQAGGRFSVTGLAGGKATPVDGLKDIAIGAGRRAQVRLDDHITGQALPVIVDSTVPLVVERSYFVSGGGVWVGPGIPLD